MNYPIKGIVVLLLEQNEKEKKLFLQVLKNSETNVASVLTATSFAEAQQLLDLNKPDIFFSSIFPEENNNEAFTNTLKELTNIIPLVMISDDDHNNISLKSLALGADDQILRKELSGPLLRKTIQYSIERKKNNEQLREAIERHQLIAKATNDIAWDWEITKKNTYWIGNGIKHILKFPKNEMNIASGFWENNLHPEDKERVINKLKQVFEKDHSNNWEDEYRFKNQEGEYKFIYDRGFIIYKNNVPVRMLGIMEDITAKVLLERKLETEKLVKQKQISEAVITAQEKERTEIGKELHDNVNQLLSASRLYIDAAITDKKNETFLLNQASSFIKNAIEEIRILSKALHTPLINELGLKESINN
ncbi:MAG TPA: PAS domain-containing protein, partial [Ferruginibacter sp.]|nr:PAS domain-containing protein [Ferruginibacter sp.]